MNFSAWIAMDDSRETFDVTRRGWSAPSGSGLDIWVRPLAANAMEAALELGEWDWIERTAADLRVEEQVVPWLATPVEHARSDRG